MTRTGQQSWPWSQRPVRPSAVSKPASRSVASGAQKKGPGAPYQLAWVTALVAMVGSRGQAIAQS